MEGGRNANYWPGFVDALGNTIIAMIFVVIVLAISVAMYVRLLAERQAARLVAQRCSQELNSQATGPVPVVPVAVASRATAPGVPSVGATEVGGGMPTPTKVVEAAQTAGPEDPASASVRDKGGVIEVFYGQQVFDMDEAGLAAFKSLVGRMRKGPGDRVEVLVMAPDMTYTENQRAAYTRAMTLRNHLLTLGYSPSNIKVRTATAPGRPDEMVARIVTLSD
jgi:hypothetical protein